MLKLVDDIKTDSNINEECCELLRTHLAECQTSSTSGVIVISLDHDGNTYYSHTSMSLSEVLGIIELVKFSIMDNQDE